MDGIKDMLDRLSDLDEGELSDLESKIIGEFETVEKQEPTAQVVDSMTALADALDAVRGEQETRVTTQRDLEQRAAEASSRVRPKEEPTDEEGAPVDPNGEAELPPEEPLAEGDDEEELKKKAAPATFAEAPAPVPVETVVETPTPTPEPVVAEESAPAAAAPSDPEIAKVEVVAPVATPASTTIEPAATSTNPPAQIEEIPVAASASDVVVTPPADNRPVPRERATVSITAGADVPGYSAGTELTSANQVADAFVKRLHNLARVSQPNGQQYTVATITASFPEERQLHDGDVDGNWAKIQNVASTSAIVAAAGACIPLEIRYDIDTQGTTDTPVIDSLPRFTADRGGIRFYPSPLLQSAEYEGALGVYDPVDGSVSDLHGNDLGGEKPCIPIQCLPFEEAVLEAVTMCMCFDNLTGRVFPELVKAHNDLAMVQHARVTEQFILEKIRAGATSNIPASNTSGIGAAREILTQVDRVAATLRYNNRISPTASFRAIFPYWLKDLIRSDIVYQMPGDGMDTWALADNKLDSWFRARNVNVTWSLETSQSATASDAVPGPLAAITGPGDIWPDTVEWDMFAEGTWLVLDGGTLDLGVIRDSSHVANNTYCEFTESFYNAVRVGGESVHVTSTLCPTGAAAALVDNPC